VLLALVCHARWRLRRARALRPSFAWLGDPHAATADEPALVTLSNPFPLSVELAPPPPPRDAITHPDWLCVRALAMHTLRAFRGRSARGVSYGAVLATDHAAPDSA
jgi:hypothetical protein